MNNIFSHGFSDQQIGLEREIYTTTIPLLILFFILSYGACNKCNVQSELLMEKQQVERESK